MTAKAAQPALLASAALLALAVFRAGPSRMPQLAAGGDALSVAFDDAKSAISVAMVNRADSYFHGGVDMGEHDCALDHDHVHDHDGGHGRDHGRGIPFDPWRWINSHVRAPHVERHLCGRQAVELMPWLWAAVSADPRNVDAWTTAWYAARSIMKDGALAKRILEEAAAKNPGSVEIAVCAGRQAYDSGRGDMAEAERAFSAARDLVLGKCGGDPSRLSEDDRRAYDFCLRNLDAIRLKSGRKK